MPLFSRVVKAGGFANVKQVLIGGANPVVIQTMWKDRLSFADLEGSSGRVICERIEALAAMGCGLLRFAAPDIEAAEVLGKLAGMVSMPLVADIHFDYKIALRCLDFPVAKIRINPGNIGSPEKVLAVLDKAAGEGRPIRIGVNAGSLPQDIRRLVDEGRLGRAEALVEAAERELAIFDKYNFKDVLVSMKASGIADTINANSLLAKRVREGGSPPLHIGVTEAGPLVAGTVRNTAALLALLAKGLGDTIRVSLSDTMENELIAGREIVAAAWESLSGTPGSDISAESRLKRAGVTIVSCPRCGRNSFDTHSFTARWLRRFYAIDRDICVAVMGCAVNGPGEARHADIGITGAGDKVLIFRKGKVIRTIDAAEADEIFAEELANVMQKN
jgi:(E)-4-hydroxy-3-methylbut-2-enyl-diphosphate synthase